MGRAYFCGFFDRDYYYYYYYFCGGRGVGGAVLFGQQENLKVEHRLQN